ncbi:retrovirus-related pol polyprotein from transposon TNT 1-94 [Tanacetum coccineum]
MQPVPKTALLCLTKRTMFHGHHIFSVNAKEAAPRPTPQPNGKLIYNSIMNGPYVRRMIHGPRDPAHTVPVPETFHEQTDDELTKLKLNKWKLMIKQFKPFSSGGGGCETANEIWLRVQQMMKGSDIGIQEKKAKLFNEWERFTSTDGESITDYTQLYDFLKYNQKEVDELRAERLAKTQDPLALMANSNNSFKYPVFHPDLPSSSTYIQQPLPNNNNYIPQPSFNQNYMQQPMPNLKDITDPTAAMNTTLALMAKAFKLNYSTPTNNNQRISSNPHNRQIAQPGMNLGQDNQMQMVGGNVGNQFRQYVRQNVGNWVVQNAIGNGNVVVALAKGNANGNNGNQIRCYNCRGLGHLARNYTVKPRRRDAAYLQTQLKKEVNANCILMANQSPSIDIGYTDLTKAPIRLKQIQLSFQLCYGNVNSVFPSILRNLNFSSLRLEFLGTVSLWEMIMIAAIGNLEGVDLLKGNRTTNLYTINLHDMASASPIFPMARATILPRKSKRASNPPKPIPNSKQRLHLLHMDLCGPMRVANINGKRYVLVIVDDYSRYTWVVFLISKDEAPEEIKNILKRITILLQAPVIIVRTDNGTEFKNQVLPEYFKSVGITHQASSVRTPQQNRAEAIATACYTQNRSIIHRRFDKTPYELIKGRKLDISFLHVFGALCYPKNDRKDIGKLGAKAMAFEQSNLKPGLQSLTSGQISSGLDLPYAPSTITTQRPTEGELDLLFEAMYDDHIGGQPVATPRTILAAQAPQVLQTPTATTTTADTAPTPTNSLSQATSIPSSSQNVDELETQKQHGQPHPASITDNVPNVMFDDNTFVNPFATPSTSVVESSSS